MPSHVRKGDTVMITSGSLKGQVGEIIRVITKSNSVIVKGLNLHTKNLRPTQTNPQGGVITKEAPIAAAKVSPVVDGKPVRVGFVTKPDGSKVRVARHGGKVLRELGAVSPSKKSAAKPAAKAEGKTASKAASKK